MNTERSRCPSLSPFRIPRLPLLAVTVFALLSLSAATIETTAPVKKFSLPTFTPEGYHDVLLRGEEVRLLGTERFDVTDMQLTFFSKKADNKVDTFFISAQATFFPSRRFAEGSQGVRVMRDDMEMAGERWSYNDVTKKVVIDGNVRVIFQTHIKDILK